MTKKDKEILFKDLCARLLYGIICKCTYPVNNETTDGEDVLFTNDYEIEGIRRRGAGFANYRRWYEITFDGETYDIDDDGIKVVPYLRPMSSMTEEEKSELKEYLDAEEVDCNGFGYTEGGTLEDYVSSIPYSLCSYVIDFLNAHHFDYRGLIEKGLALEAPEGMYKAEELK